MPGQHVMLASHEAADPSCGHDSAIMYLDGLGLLTDANTERQGLMKSRPSYFQITLETNIHGLNDDADKR